jgi:hypothetical protein
MVQGVDIDNSDPTQSVLLERLSSNSGADSPRFTRLFFPSTFYVEEKLPEVDERDKFPTHIFIIR